MTLFILPRTGKTNQKHQTKLQHCNLGSTKPFLSVDNSTLFRPGKLDELSLSKILCRTCQKLVEARSLQCAAVLALSTMLFGCAGTQPLSVSAPGATTGQTPTGLVPLGVTAPKEVVPYDEAQPSASAEVGAAATTLATDAVTVFCRPALDRQTWIDGLYPYLSQTAAVAYGMVNPARVPCSEVTGGARVRDGDGTYTVRVIVPTDAGEYSVYVHRPDVSDPWLVEQITPLAAG